MTLTLNGEPREFDDLDGGASVGDLIHALGLDDAPVLIELNGAALIPAEFAKSLLAEGDALEVIQIVAGG